MTKHGQARGGASRTYVSWSMMKQRCLNPNYEPFKRYGGKGIDVCKEWLVFDNFFSDMGERPIGTSLDRIDGRLGYSKNNCRWATRREQLENRYKYYTYKPKFKKRERPNPVDINIPEFKYERDEMLFLRGMGCTLEKIGRYFGLSRERIRQIINK
jgi:hypothetical protein